MLEIENKISKVAFSTDKFLNYYLRENPSNQHYSSQSSMDFSQVEKNLDRLF